MNLELRPLQSGVIAAVAEAFRAGHRRVMVYGPCGFGKTEVATAMLQATHKNGKRGAFVADRISLVTQTSERFDKYDLPHGVMQAQHWRYAPSEAIQVCSIQTLRKRAWPALNLLVIDEAHILPEAIKQKLGKKDCYAIGLSATPLTRGLGKYFDCVINATTTNHLISTNALVAPHVFSFDQPDMAGVKINSLGEWDQKAGEERVMQVVGDAVDTYLQHGDGKKFICFAWSIVHAEELARQFIASGINVSTYTADDDPEDRHENVKEFKKPDSTIRGLISVEALTRGFDVADVEILIDCHPLRNSLATYIQMLGRVMRWCEGKTKCLVFDHSGNAIHFWSAWKFLFEHGVDVLDDGERKKGDTAGDEQQEPEPMRCPKCWHTHPPRPSCPNCGHEYPKRSAVAHVPGTLKEIVASGDKALMKAKLWPQVCWIVANDRKPRDATHAEGMARAIYFELTGVPTRDSYSATAPEQATPEVRGKVKANLIRYIHGQKKAEKARRAVPA